MADKSCENCGYEGCPVDKGTTTCCDNWTPITPPTPNEVIRARANIIDGQDIGTVEINLNNSPELIAWARSKALELVEIDESKLQKQIGVVLAVMETEGYIIPNTAQKVMQVIRKIIKNPFPIKLKTK